MHKPRKNRWRTGMVNLGVVVMLLAAVSYLPSDTSLAERQKAGTLTACLPPNAPPLVTDRPEAPGFDTEVLAEIAKRLGLRLVVNPSPAIGKDFNPRNWHITRARCVIVAGGLTDTLQTRSFLQVVPTGVRTGWALIAPADFALGTGRKVAVLPGSGGLSRVALSAHLRKLGVEARSPASPEALRQGLGSGQIEAVIAEYFAAETLLAQLGGANLAISAVAPDELGAPYLGLGLWKGDLTLKRAVVSALSAMEQDGTLARIGKSYGLTPQPL